MKAFLLKNNLFNILGDLNSKGSIIRGITFGNNQGQSVQSSMDLQVTVNFRRMFPFWRSISDHNLPISSRWLHADFGRIRQEFISSLILKTNPIQEPGRLDLLDDKTYCRPIPTTKHGFGI